METQEEMLRRLNAPYRTQSTKKEAAKPAPKTTTKAATKTDS